MDEMKPYFVGPDTPLEISDNLRYVFDLKANNDALLRVAMAVVAFADDRWSFDIVSDSATPATWLAVIDALKEVEHLLGVDK